jgi:hypothetical protein
MIFPWFSLIFIYFHYLLLESPWSNQLARHFFGTADTSQVKATLPLSPNGRSSKSGPWSSRRGQRWLVEGKMWPVNPVTFLTVSKKDMEYPVNCRSLKPMHWQVSRCLHPYSWKSIAQICGPWRTNVSEARGSTIPNLTINGWYKPSIYCCYTKLVGGFKHFFIFHNTWDNPSHWLIFFRGVETTNQ